MTGALFAKWRRVKGDTVAAYIAENFRMMSDFSMAEKALRRVDEINESVKNGDNRYFFHSKFQVEVALS
jgi:predicted DNA-binding protein